jgi:hypothetical protein
MGSTEWHRVSDIALKEAALGGSSTMPQFQRERITTPFPATLYMLNITPSFRLGYDPVKGLLFTSQTNPANSAPTSSNTQRSAASSSTTGGTGRKNFGRKEESLPKDKKVVRIEAYRPEVQPEEGDWFQVQAYHKPNEYSFPFPNDPRWINEGRGSSTLDGVLQAYVDAKEVYAKVRILKTTRKVVTFDGE